MILKSDGAGRDERLPYQNREPSLDKHSDDFIYQYVETYEKDNKQHNHTPFFY